MTIRFLSTLAAAMLFTLPVSEAVSHGGGLNSAGCHTNRKTGDYHCHRARTPPPGRITYCHVINGEYRCGYAASTCYNLVGQFGGYCVRRQ